MSNVIIEIRGDNVVGVYGQSRKTRVTIVDLDNWEAGGIPSSVCTVFCLSEANVPKETMEIITSSKTNTED